MSSVQYTLNGEQIDIGGIIDVTVDGDAVTFGTLTSSITVDWSALAPMVKAVQSVQNRRKAYE